MITIDIGNSYSKINNLTSVLFNSLRKELSYTIDKQAAYFSYNVFNTTKYCIDKQGVFPTGLLDRVCTFLVTNNLAYERNDNRKQPKALKVKLEATLAHKPHWFQTEAVDFIVKNKRGIISAPTGSGKSLIIALIAARLNVRTLVVVPSVEIKEQLISQLVSIFGHTHSIQVYNVASPILETKTDFDCLIIDEAHHVASKTYQKLNKKAWANTYYRVFVTATPFRNKTEESMLFEGIAGTAVYKLDYHKAVEHKFIVPLEAYFIQMPKQKTNAISWQEVYRELVVNNDAKNYAIAAMLKALRGKAILCLVKEVAHGKILSQLTGIPFVNGQDDESRAFIGQFNRGEQTALIGTEGILGEGVDSRPCEYVIIAGAGKAKSSFMQKCGRCLRVYPGKVSGKVILIQDKSHKFLNRHFLEQCTIMKQEYGLTPIKLEI